MKNNICLMLVLLFVSNTGKSQNNYNSLLKEIESRDSVIWFGIDFSNAKLIGDFPNRGIVKDAYLEAWNSIVISNDLLSYLRSKQFLYDLSVVKKRNKAITEDKLFSMITQNLTIDTIQMMINDYKPEIKNGKGLVLIVESFDKNLEQAQIWVAYFDIKTHKVIYTEKISGYAKGTTMVNHWGSAITDVIKYVPDGLRSKRTSGTKFLSGIFLGFMIIVGLIVLTS